MKHIEKEQIGRSACTSIRPISVDISIYYVVQDNVVDGSSMTGLLLVPQTAVQQGTLTSNTIAFKFLISQKGTN